MVELVMDSHREYGIVFFPEYQLDGGSILLLVSALHDTLIFFGQVDLDAWART